MRFHTSLPVNDIKDTVAFYRVLFDAPPVKAKSDYAKFLPPGRRPEYFVPPRPR
jgi:catechol 2,3-dioxygenase-like lactoylglutathione lyase family enzyme